MYDGPLLLSKSFVFRPVSWHKQRPDLPFCRIFRPISGVVRRGLLL